MTDLTLFILLLLAPFCMDHKTQFRRNMGAWLLAIFLILLFGLRHYTVGTDSANYAMRFQTLSDLAIFEPGFIWFMKTLHAVCAHYAFFFLATSAIFWGLLIRFYNKYTATYWLAVFLFCSLGGINTIANNGIRQGLAIVFFLSAIPCALEKQWLKYYLLALLAFSFHRSALFIFPFYFLLQVKFKWEYVFVVVAGFMILLGFAEPITNFLFSDYEKYLIEVEQVSQGKLVQLMLGSFFALLPLYGHYKTRQHDPHTKNMLLWMMVSYILCAWGTYISDVGGALNRLTWYLSPIVWLNFAKYVEEKPTRLRFLILVAIVCLIFCYRLGVYRLSDTVAQSDMIYYYKFFWQ